MSSGGPLSLCGNSLKAGTYAFGLRRPAAAHGGDSKFVLYDQAGETVRECISKRDPDLTGPRPLQAVSHTPNSVRLYLGRYWIEMRPYMQSHPMPCGWRYALSRQGGVPYGWPETVPSPWHFAKLDGRRALPSMWVRVCHQLPIAVSFRAAYADLTGRSFIQLSLDRS